jgi:hypothetical protein
MRGIGLYTNLYGAKNVPPLRRGGFGGVTAHASDTANVFPQMGATTRRKAGQEPREKPCTRLRRDHPRLPPTFARGAKNAQEKRGELGLNALGHIPGLRLAARLGVAFVAHLGNGFVNDPTGSIDAAEWTVLRQAVPGRVR